MFFYSDVVGIRGGAETTEQRLPYLEKILCTAGQKGQKRKILIARQVNALSALSRLCRSR